MRSWSWNEPGAGNLQIAAFVVRVGKMARPKKMTTEVNGDRVLRPTSLVFNQLHTGEVKVVELLGCPYLLAQAHVVVQ
jgi:hypothetical protein